jgi:peptidoglycan hydrolase-like protein with peptidoglycan-binding domain
VRRTAILSLALSAVVVVGLGGWVAGRSIKSPAQVAAEAEPPAASRITVPVELRTLSSDIIVRGDVRFDLPEIVTLQDPPAVLGGAAIVTLAPAEDSDLAEGSLALEVSGRPILVLQGELPMFRTMRPGDAGDDVLQLEEALSRIGFEPGGVDGIFDTATGDAIEAWYRSLGYEPIGPSDQERAELDAAAEAVRAAQQEVSGAQGAVTAAQKPLPQSQVLQMEAAVRAAERALAESQTMAVADNAAAAQAVTVADQALQASRTAASIATARLSQAQAGTHPDTLAPPTPEELADLEAELAQANATVVVDQNALTVAQAAQTEIQRQGERATADAADQVTIAKAQLAEATAPIDTAMERAALAAANQRLADAKDKQAELQSRSGNTAPRSEILFLDALPVRVDEAFVVRGDTVTGDVMQVTGSRLAIDTAIDVADAPLVEVGDAVVIEETFSDISTTGVVSFKAERAGTKEVGAQQVYLEVLADEDIRQLNGVNVKLTIPVETTGGDVLAVPLAALSAAADETARVEVEHDDGSTTLVEVRTGLSAGGFVQVTPLNGMLDAGDRVVVGQQPATGNG